MTAEMRGRISSGKPYVQQLILRAGSQGMRSPCEFELQERRAATVLLKTGAPLWNKGIAQSQRQT
jgi:hypothetical protein